MLLGGKLPWALAHDPKGNGQYKKCLINAPRHRVGSWSVLSRQELDSMILVVPFEVKIPFLWLFGDAQLETPLGARQ